MFIFDCNCRFGRAIIPPIAFSENVPALEKQMDFCGIDEALVLHTGQIDQCPSVGNPLLMKEIEEHPRLHPVWAILPPQTDELGGVDAFLDSMRQNGVHALRAFPTEHKYLINRPTFGQLFEAMSERRIPLFLSVREAPTAFAAWDLAARILQDFPELRLVMLDHGPWGHDRFFRPLIEKYEGLYIDTSRYELDQGVSKFCEKYGAERMLFGTGYPDANMGGSLMTVLHADICDNDREAILGLNLKRLLSEAEP